MNYRTHTMPEARTRRVLTVHLQTAALALALTITATTAAVLLTVAYLTSGEIP